MALETPAEWLPVLAQRLDDSQPHIARLRSYVDGNAPLPEMGKNTRATWLAFQRKARTNVGGIACSSHANRIMLRGVRVGSDDQSVASKAARRISRDNRLAMQIADAVWDMLSARRGYLVVGASAGKAVITAEKPELFYGEPDPVNPWVTRAAIKVFRDTVEGLDYALVWATGSRQWFVRKSYMLAGTDKQVRMVNAGGWIAFGEPELFDGAPPVWILDRRDGMGLIEPHLDVVDRINLGKLQRLVVTAMQAFKQRGVKKGVDNDMPEKDENGNVIDYSKVFEAAPGALWDMPAGVDIWESQQTDIRPLLDGETKDARDFSAVTGTPAPMLTPESQSAQGASNTTQQQVDACNADIARIKLAAAACILTALRVESVDFGDETVEVDFEDPQWVTLAEKMDAYSKGVASGMSVQMAQKMFLGWTQDQIDEDDRNRRLQSAREVLAGLSGQPQPVAVPVGNAG